MICPLSQQLAGEGALGAFLGVGILWDKDPLGGCHHDGWVSPGAWISCRECLCGWVFLEGDHPWRWLSLRAGCPLGGCPSGSVSLDCTSFGDGNPGGGVSLRVGVPGSGIPWGPADSHSLQCSFLPKFSIYIETKYEDNCGDSENVSVPRS